MEMVIQRPGACRHGLLVVPEELCGILERGTGMGVSGCLGCQGAGAVSVDLHMVWSCFSSGTGARGFLLLPAGARPSRTFATASQKPSDTAKSQRVGDQLSSPL